MNKTAITIAAAALLAIPSFAQPDRNATLINFEKEGFEYEIKAGVNIGGTVPSPFPAEIRSIDSYSPRLNGSLEGIVTYWMGEERKWGVAAGLRVEVKGMSTGATVKNYSTEIIDGGSRVAGYWTGYVNTDYNSTQLTLPITANYRISDYWKVRAGAYASYCLDNQFSGYVGDGYLRESTPTGQKIEFSGDDTAQYDFSGNLRKMQYGLQAGASWQAFKHFSLSADLCWSFNGLFPNDFKTVTFDMYPLYLNVGFAYTF